eukprot:304062-Chlamydomonas_euryale.AAC.14
MHMGMAEGSMACNDHGDKTGSELQLLHQFLGVQRERAENYSIFHKQFRTFLQTRNDMCFKEAMAAATSAFNRCSKQVIQIEMSLRDELQRSDLAALLRKVQVRKIWGRLRTPAFHLDRSFSLCSFSSHAEEDAC